jgi:hypothetical protein
VQPTVHGPDVVDDLLDVTGYLDGGGFQLEREEVRSPLLKPSKRCPPLLHQLG